MKVEVVVVALGMLPIVFTDDIVVCWVWLFLARLSIKYEGLAHIASQHLTLFCVFLGVLLCVCRVRFSMFHVVLVVFQLLSCCSH